MMNNVVTGAKIVGAYVQPGTKENLDYLKVTEQRSTVGGSGGFAGKKDPSLPAKPKMSIADANYDNTVSMVVGASGCVVGSVMENGHCLACETEGENY